MMYPLNFTSCRSIQYIGTNVHKPTFFKHSMWCYCFKTTYENESKYEMKRGESDIKLVSDFLFNVDNY